MDRTEQGDSPVMDRVRTGGLSRVLTNRFRPWQ